MSINGKSRRRRHRIHAKNGLLALGVLAAVLAEVVAWTSGNDRSMPVTALALFAIVAGGLGTYKKGWIALKTSISTLMP
jgi:Cd2+/Zn2+-exporting ATPase